MESRYAILDQLQNVYAIRETEAKAIEAKADAEMYLDGAATCGHPSAVPWVNERLPIRIVVITEDEATEFLHEVPILDREP